ncbi:MAG: LapA family protein [Candidatus Cloacimonadota bacterium]|nr:MAG: LapA family protein [Candidatus Cloacimonadota bacterium]
MVLFVLLWAAIFTIVGMIIGTQNGNTLVDVSILIWTFRDLPLTLVLIETFAIGIFFTILVAIIDEFRLKNRIWRSQNEIKALKKELSTLRNIPLQDTMIEKNEEKEKPQEEKTVKQKESK